MAEPKQSASPAKPQSLFGVTALGIIVLALLYVIFTPRLVGLVGWSSIHERMAIQRTVASTNQPYYEVSEAIARMHRGTANGFYENLYREYESRFKLISPKEIILSTVADRPLEQMLSVTRLIHLLGVAWFGVFSIVTIGRSEGQHAARRVRLFMWLAYVIGVAAGVFSTMLFSSLTATFRMPYYSPFLVVLAASALTLALPWFSGIRQMSHSESTTAFGSLTYRSLPPGTLRGRAFNVRYENEHAFPVENIGAEKLTFVDSVLYVLNEKKMKDVVFWRCSAESDARSLLLVERNLGFLSRVWCLVDVQQPGGGTDLTIKLHRLTPRNIDWMDLTGVRYLIFPLAIAYSLLNLLMSWSGRGDTEWTGDRLSLSILGFGTMLAGVVAVVTGLNSAPSWPLVIALFALVVLVSFILYVFEAKDSNAHVIRASTELFQTVTQAVHMSLIPMRRSV